MSHKATGNIPKLRLHRPSGRAVVTLDGKDVYLGRYGTAAAHAAYDRTIAEWLSAGRSVMEHDAGPDDPPTISNIIANYLKHARDYYNAGSEYVQAKYACAELRRLYGATDARDFGPLGLKAVRERWIKAGWSRQHINHQLHRVRRMVRWAVGCQMLHPDVLHALEAVDALRHGHTDAREAPPVRVVPDGNVDAVLPRLAGPVRAMVELQRLTGMRPGEVVILRPVDVDTTAEIWEYRPEHSKVEHRGEVRVVPLGPRAQAILRPFLRRAVDAYCFDPHEAVAERAAGARTHRRQNQKPNARRTRRRLRHRYDVDTYRRAVEYACRKAGVPVWCPLQLRHLAATRIRKERGLESAQHLLGHKHASVSEIYAEKSLDAGRELARLYG